MCAYHDATAANGSIERGNTLGDRSSVRQSRYFRQYESGNNVKDLLGTGHLQWDVNKKEGVFDGHSVYDGAKLDYAPPAARFGRRAGAVSKKQQAAALVSARELVVDGACQICIDAVRRLEAGGLTIKEEDKVRIITNLLTVVCSDDNAKPVVPL